ncbi:MAG: hypothetical protein LBF59_08405 [Prevotellaceae bacterium]|jgi:hypothetical protein|nr:hypothetical protein [Prevotellaceae bacterium]
MAHKIINTVAGIILPITVIALTVTLFFMFRPENCTVLFYLNVGYTVLLEAIFFGYINLLYRKITAVSTPFIAVFGIYSLYYVIAGAGWMTLYSLILSHIFSLKIYIAALIILTLLWIIISVLTMQADNRFKEAGDKLNERRHTLEYYTQKIALLASRYEKLCEEKGIHYATESNNRTVLDRLKSKIGFLTPNVLNNEMFYSQLTAMLDRCETIIEETALAPEDALPEWEKKMYRFVNNSIDELDMLKNMTRS